MSKIDKNANLYDIDGNLIARAPLKNETISEVERLVDELTKKIEENPENEVYKVYLNNAQSFLFGMYNNMSREDLMSRLSVLQDSIQSAKDKANEAELEKLAAANKALDELKESVGGTFVGTEMEQPVVESAPITESVSDKMDEYVEFEEIKD